LEQEAKIDKIMMNCRILILKYRLYK